jgi:hypothetical protein
VVACCRFFWFLLAQGVFLFNWLLAGGFIHCVAVDFGLLLVFWLFSVVVGVVVFFLSSCWSGLGCAFFCLPTMLPFLVFLFSVCVAPFLFAYGVGLSLFSYRSIGVAPVRGGTVVV